MAKRRQPMILEELEPPVIEEIEDAAKRYVQARDRRMKMFKEEIEAWEALHDAMTNHKLVSYEYDGKVVSLDSTTKVKVRRKKGEDNDADE